MTTTRFSEIAFGMVEYFDVFKYVLSRFINGLVDSAPYAFALQEVDEAIVNRQQQNFALHIVVAIATPTHRVFEIV